MDYLKISDEKVTAKTGKGWPEWFQILDSLKAKKLGHTLTAKRLGTIYHLNGWWSQVVTVRYEKEKGYWVRHGA